VSKMDPKGRWSAVFVEGKEQEPESQKAEYWANKRELDGRKNLEKVRRQAELIRELKGGIQGAREYDVIKELRELGTNNVDDLLGAIRSNREAPTTETKKRSW